MIRHIVMWKYKEELDNKARRELFEKLCRACLDMNGNIDGLISATLKENVNENEVYDLCLVCDMESLDSTLRYQDDKMHVAFKNIIIGNVKDRACIDIEI